MTHTPCQDAPDDWFIDKSGKQYPDDEPERSDLEVLALLRQQHPTYLDEQLDWALLQYRTNEHREALSRRRRAKDRCFTECPVRLGCLGIAFDPTLPDPNVIPHGTYGGYHPEEREKMAKAVVERRRR